MLQKGVAIEQVNLVDGCLCRLIQDVAPGSAKPDDTDLLALEAFSESTDTGTI